MVIGTVKVVEVVGTVKVVMVGGVRSFETVTDTLAEVPTFPATS